MANLGALDYVAEATTTTGTDDFELGGAVNNMRAFGDAMSDGDTVEYACYFYTGAALEWETGLGTYDTATDTLARTTVLSSSNADAKVSFSAGTKTVLSTPIAKRHRQMISGGYAQTLTDAEKAQAQSNIGISPSDCQGRLTLSSGVPVPTSDLTAQGTVYFTPFRGNVIWVFTGSVWKPMTFTEKSLALSGLTASKPADIFAYDNSGTVALEGVSWTNDTTRATAIAYQDGVAIKSGDATRRYLGSIYVDSSNQCTDTLEIRYVWNMYNRVRRPMMRKEATDSWTYTTASFRDAANSTSNRLRFFRGLDEDSVSASLVAMCSSTTTVNVIAAIGLDSSSTRATDSINGVEVTPAASVIVSMRAEYCGLPGIGLRSLRWLEYSSASGTTTWLGDGGAALYNSGLTGSVLA